MEQPVETWTVRVDAELGDFETKLAAATGSGRQFSRALTSAFQSVSVQGKGVGDTLNTLAMRLSQIALQAAFKPLDQVFGSFFQSLLGGGFGVGGGGGGGMPVPFAAGGVISSPIAFPLQGGATGIAGERGAEAIMPLARGPDGRLGVAAGTAGGNVSVTFNVSTPDVESFKRTETQLAAMLNRAIASGQRNM